MTCPNCRENAALACLREIENRFNNLCGLSVAVICGKGNNGGDGFAIARHLCNKGAYVTVFLASGEPTSNDARVNYDICKKIGMRVENDNGDFTVNCFFLTLTKLKECF